MLAIQAAFEAEHGLKPSDTKRLRDSLDDSDGGFSVGNGDDKVVEAAVTQPQLNQPVRPLPAFSSNFGPSSMQLDNGDESSMEAALKVDGSEVNGSAADHNPQVGNPAEDPTRQRLFNEGVPHEQQQQQPPPPPQAMPPQQQQQQQQYPPFGANGTAGGGGHTPTGPTPNTFSPNFNYGNGSPLHSGFDRGVKGGPSPSHMGHARNASGATAGGPEDVTTKSISGLESLVDQIPAIAENDSGVFSGSGAGSHPNTPRSVGPYSPAAGGPGSFHTSPFHTPTASSHFNLGDHGSGPTASGATNEPSTNYHPPTDFSVNSLVHPRSNSEGVACQQPSPVTFSSDSSFSVSSLTSSYANDMAAKYAANPAYAYAASAASAAAGYGPGSFNSFMGAAAAAGPMTAGPPMGPMTPMGAMSLYGQYSNTYGAAAGAASAAAASASFAPNPYYMPNPGYPYSHHYGQYSQSPYF